MRIPGRIPVTIHPLFWLFAILIGWLNSGSVVGTIIWALVILVSLLVHEFGHALTSVGFGQQAQIELMFFGGRTMHGGKKLPLWKDFIITLNGPLSGLALGAAAWGIIHTWQLNPIAHYALMVTALVNFFWTVLNLLPIMPLDGGQLLRIILEGIFGAKGLSLSLLVGMVLGAAAAVAGFVFGYFLVGAIFFILTFESGRAWATVRHMSESDRDEGMQKLFGRGEMQMQQGQTEEALNSFEQVRQRTEKGLLFVASTEAAARLLEKRGDISKAYDYLKSIKKHLPAASLPLLHRLAYANGDYALAVQVGKDSFQAVASYDVAFINALSHAALGEVEATVGWLKCALREGMPNPAEALNNSGFDIIRREPLFQDLEKSV